MNKLKILIVLLISQIYLAQSDIDSDQHQIYTYLYSGQLEKAKSLIDSKLLASNDYSRKIIGYVYLVDYYNFFNDKEEKKVLALENAKKIALQTHEPIDEAYVDYGYTRYYLKLNKNDLFIKVLNKSISTFSKYPKQNFILTQLYFLKSNYKIKNILEKNTGVRSDFISTNKHAIQSGNNLLINYSYNNLGYYYSRMYDATSNKKYLDSAQHSYRNSYIACQKIENPIARKKSLMVYHINYGGLLSSMISDDGKQSLQEYKKGLALFKNEKSLISPATLLFNNIGSIYENIGKYDLAEPYLLTAYKMSKNNENVHSVNRVKILDNLSILYEKKGQLQKALNFSKDTQELIKSESQKQFESNTKSLEIFYETEKKSQQIKHLEQTNEIYKKKRVLYVAITVLSVICIVFLLYLLRAMHRLNAQKIELLKNEAQLEKEEKARLKIEQDLLELKQEQLQKQTLAASLQLNKKNTFIKELKDKVKNNSGDKHVIEIEKFLKEEQLIDNEFNEIQNIIQKVHPDFFKKINEVSKNKLTNLDLKYAAYIYLNMDNLQISNVLKVDPNTVRKTKYRLKQKIGLHKEDDLLKFIQDLKI